MKRICALLIAIICLLGMAGCGEPLQAENRETPIIKPADAVTSSATAEPTPLATLKPADTPSTTATTKTTDVATVALPEGLAVVCDSYGGVYGGYFNGKWRIDSEVARYLDVPVTFYAYNLLGKRETVESKGVSYSDADGENISSWAKDNSEYGSGVYELEIDGWWGGDASSYTESPLEYYLLYNLGPECMPDIYAVEDTSKAKSAIQGMLNKQFGKDAPEAEIIIAVSADIDADGKQETVINAANDEDNVYGYYCDKPLYCISCVIEDNGEIVVIDEYYLDSEDAADIYYNGEEHEEYDIEEGDDIAFYADIRFFYILNIIDLDNDGVCEFVLIGESYEAWDTTVYKYEGKTFDAVLSYGGGV